MEHIITHEGDIIDDEKLNEEFEESDYCEFISGFVKPYNNKNIQPFPIYIKDNLPIILEALAEVERLRPKNPVEFFSVYLLQKANKQ